jgi:hypothetical protein
MGVGDIGVPHVGGADDGGVGYGSGVVDDNALLGDDSIEINGVEPQLGDVVRGLAGTCGEWF